MTKPTARPVRRQVHIPFPAPRDILRLPPQDRQATMRHVGDVLGAMAHGLLLPAPAPQAGAARGSV